MSENRLRSDLYYRLNTFQIEVPPLRERKEDIPPLVTFFVKQFAEQMGKARTGRGAGRISEVARLLVAGNVRELQNSMEYAVVLARQDLIGIKELPAEVQLPAVLERTERMAMAPAAQGVQSLDDVERATILQALAQCHGNKKKAAQLLGIQRPTLYNKMKRYIID